MASYYLLVDSFDVLMEKISMVYVWKSPVFTSSLDVMRYIRVISGIFMLLYSLGFYAQENIGMQLSDYTPASSLHLNPAFMVDSKTRVDIHVGGLSAYACNEHVFYKGDAPGVIPVLFGNTTNPTQDTDIHPRDGYLDFAVEGPGAAIVIGRSSVGLSTRYRGMVNAKEVPHELAQFIYHGFRHYPFYDIPFKVDKMQASLMTWGEVGFSFAHMFQVESTHHLSGGLTVKRLFGQSHVGIDVQSMEYMFTSDNLYIDKFTGGYSIGTSSLLIGNGWGVDLGVVYRKTIDGSSDYIPYSIGNRCKKSRYRYELGISLLDFGKVNFDERSEVKVSDASTVWFNYIDAEINDLAALDERLEFQFENDQNNTERTRGTFVSLPTTLSVQFDYNLDKGFFLGSVLHHPLRSGRPYDLRRASVFGVIPRYETESLEFSLPISTYEYDRLQIGAALRYKFVTIGSDNFGALVSDSDLYGMDIYTSVRIPIYRRKDCKEVGGGKRTLIAPCWGQ